MKTDRLFDELFPASSRRFDVSAVHSRTWADGDQTSRARLWYLDLEADRWLAYAASYRDFTDMFRRLKFVYAFEHMRTELSIVASRKKNDQISQDDRAEWKGFLDRRLTDDELSALDEWEPTPVQIWDYVDQLFSAGYRLTLSYNKKTHLSSCTIIDDHPGRETGGYALSSSDDDGSLALKMAIFKHFVLLEGTWDGIMGSSPKGRRG